ncbi:UDP-glucose dehydrogenase family protein [Hansschlegelia zhihuaiae]|uniref:UDP-glucose 6-dehydrogenase n=1 Tax=Hansschlegelia zhihuaiae TaxID=405005 RepID=A0A4V1KHF6_9HYPH|nr:UDP-glucose/GDP-mannose dehydrogenase family protein [Hansschlegelia zhihuaiae]RXF67022.1 UDP-glucose/GDP-mannose dehydrogenase family protein [Hansschlegelia zhihuaiae]
MRIAVVGSGYVGLVSGACLADFGHTVVCVDNDNEKIEALLQARVPIFEPGLDELVATNIREGRLHFTTDLAGAVSNAEVVFIAVGTPSRHGDGHADLTYVYAAAREIAGAIKDFTVIVDKSTVPVGTGDEVERVIRKANPVARFSVASNPEFLREGAAIADFKHPDRIVVGVEDDMAKEVLTNVYRPLNLNRVPIMFTRRRTAELVKYASNAFLAMKITFINELADLCESLDADIQDVALGLGLDNRIGPKFLHAGPGYGGSCFPKDTIALARTAQDAATPLRLVESTIAINDQRRRSMARRVIAACDGVVRDKTIGVLGLTFKPNTDDIRESPALSIIQALKDRGAKVRAYDPKGREAAAELLSSDDVYFASDPYDAAADADALVIVTEWDVFRALDLRRLREVMKSPVLVDLRNVYGYTQIEQAGFSYHCIGRPRQASSVATSQAAE